MTQFIAVSMDTGEGAYISMDHIVQVVYPPDQQMAEVELEGGTKFNITGPSAERLLVLLEMHMVGGKSQY